MTPRVPVPTLAPSTTTAVTSRPRGPRLAPAARCRPLENIRRRLQLQLDLGDTSPPCLDAQPTAPQPSLFPDGARGRSAGGLYDRPVLPLLTDAAPAPAASPWEFSWDAIGALGSGLAALVAIAVATLSWIQSREAASETGRAAARLQRAAARRVVVWQEPNPEAGHDVPVYLGNHSADPITRVRLVHQPSTTRSSDGRPTTPEPHEVGSWPVVAPGQTVSGLRPPTPPRSAGHGYLRAEFVDVHGREWSRFDSGALTRGAWRRDFDEIEEDSTLLEPPKRRKRWRRRRS